MKMAFFICLIVWIVFHIWWFIKFHQDPHKILLIELLFFFLSSIVLSSLTLYFGV